MTDVMVMLSVLFMGQCNHGGGSNDLRVIMGAVPMIFGP